ncbi:MAG: hypothetical protein ACYDBQ_12000 [Thermoplasmatota archaeon]
MAPAPRIGPLRRQARRFAPPNVGQADLLIARLAALQRVTALQAVRELWEAAPATLLRFGARYYSQNDEDGIVHEILRRVGEGGRRFVEIGASDGRENNTIHLLLQGWSGLWVEGSPERCDAARARWAGPVREGRLEVRQQMVDADNVKALRERASQADVLSLDIDGNDYHILEALGRLSARLVVLEYNAALGPWVDWVMPYDAQHSWDGTDRYGASLLALERQMRGQGYALVACNVTGVNAFFVPQPLAEAHFDGPFTTEAQFQPARPWLQEGLVSGGIVGMGAR